MNAAIDASPARATELTPTPVTWKGSTPVPAGVLHVMLGDGFLASSVAVSCDGREVYRKRGVTTDASIAAADSFEVPLRGATMTLSFVVDARAYVARVPLAGGRFVQLSVGATPTLLQATDLPLLD